ncbi:Potassium voltage-gated channel protein eag [Hondaea fermentalgiana]|uniref:Potassium voltage-gated channel protein eag n=1 Tax=Hondaea fermentalgiana TaxID=2315210 RepID=A0A2R5GTC7_9STRA|nr:Potassium voltage-gated channel protein eag [Hondaea fermentalgiana]|eukprot:GBG33835.1 Potassium voltage-gated channel protein eag [Hondaea fermentalgiana]
MARWDVMQVDAASIAAQAARQGASTIPVPLTRKQTVSKALGLDRVFSTSKRLHGGTEATFSSGILDTVESDTHSQRSHYSAPSSNLQRALAALFTTQQGFILPSSKNLHWWSLIVSGFMVYLLLVAPYRLAVHRIDHEPELVAVLTDTIAALVFALDIVIRLNTGVVNPRTREEDIRKLRTKYARSRLIRDVLGCIPVELLGLSLRNTGDAGQGIMMALAIMRLSRGTHVVNLESTLAGEHFNLNRGIRRLIATVVFVPLMSHLFACLWIFVGSRPRNPDMNDTWLEVFLATNASEEQNVDVFIAALEWSVSTLSSVGFGDFSGVNDEEHIVSILACACGALLAGVLIAQTSSIVSDMNEAQHQIDLRMHSLRAYLRYRRVPKSLQMRMIRYFRHVYTRRAHFDEVSILENMTADLRRALSLYLLEDTLQDLDIFRGISDTQLVASLIAMLKPVSFSAGTEIVRQGEPITEMYFIVRGKVEVLAPGDEAVVSDVQDEKGSTNEEDKDRTAADGSQKLRNKLRVIATLGEVPPHSSDEHDSSSEMDDLRTTASDLISNGSNVGDEEVNVQRELRGAEPTEDGNDVCHKESNLADIEWKSSAPAGQVSVSNEQETEASAQRNSKTEDAIMSPEKAAVDTATNYKTSPLVDPLACGFSDPGANVHDLVRDLLETARLQDNAIAALRARLANRKRKPGSRRGFSATEVSTAQAVH